MTELTTIEAALIRHTDGSAGVVPVQSAACRSCGMCSAAVQPAASDARLSTIRLSLPGNSLAFAAIGVYGVPLFGLLLGALLAAALGANDALTAVAAMTGCIGAGVTTSGLTRFIEARTLDELEKFSDVPAACNDSTGSDTGKDAGIAALFR